MTFAASSYHPTGYTINNLYIYSMLDVPLHVWFVRYSALSVNVSILTELLNIYLSEYKERDNGEFRLAYECRYMMIVVMIQTRAQALMTTRV